MSLLLYGIPNCDTVRKARAWLRERGVEYAFHDLRKEGLDRSLLARWEAIVGWERLLNRRGITWRRLPPERREGVDREHALALLEEHPTLVKRPVTEWPDGTVTVGFDADDWTARIGR